MTKLEFKDLIFSELSSHPDVILLKNRLVTLYEWEDYETMSKIKLWIDELKIK